MTRRTSTHSEVRGGCHDCKGATPIWTGKNAMALAARHHDATGHQTWAEQMLSITYGDTGPAQPDMFTEERQCA